MKPYNFVVKTSKTGKRKQSVMNAVVDRFDKDVLTIPEDKSHFRITVPVAVNQQFFGWVFGLGKSVRIVEPESVKKQMMKALADIMERYEGV